MSDTHFACLPFAHVVWPCPVLVKPRFPVSSAVYCYLLLGLLVKLSKQKTHSEKWEYCLFWIEELCVFSSHIPGMLFSAISLNEGLFNQKLSESSCEIGTRIVKQIVFSVQFWFAENFGSWPVLKDVRFFWTNREHRMKNPNGPIGVDFWCCPRGLVAM